MVRTIGSMNSVTASTMTIAALVADDRSDADADEGPQGEGEQHASDEDPGVGLPELRVDAEDAQHARPAATAAIEPRMP